MVAVVAAVEGTMDSTIASTSNTNSTTKTISLNSTVVTLKDSAVGHTLVTKSAIVTAASYTSAAAIIAGVIQGQ